MSAKPQIVFDEWGTYVSDDGEKVIFVSYDEGATQEDRPAELTECIRVLVQMHLTEDDQLTSEENSQLYTIEEDLCAMLENARVHCRLIGRLTYETTREIVFQVADAEGFHKVFAAWQKKHDAYEVQETSHEGWGFFDEVLSPTDADRIFMADQAVVERLIEAGSNADKEHRLEYVFCGDADALEGIATVLEARGYQFDEKADYASEQIVMCKSLPLDLGQIVSESLANHQLAEECGVVCDGWGCAIVS